MVIKIDAGVANALALDSELVVATKTPAAVQCIRWTPDKAGKQTSTEVMSRMTWMQKSLSVVQMVYDRAMSLAVWITSNGGAYAVQRVQEGAEDSDKSRGLFRGYGFHHPDSSELEASKAAINARFSLLAIGCANGGINVYTARDYAGSIPISHKLQAPVSLATSGILTCLAYSPDGYCLFAGYEHGWSIWSVYGKPGASSFIGDENLSQSNDEGWLLGVKGVSWLNSGTNLLLSCPNDDRLWLVEMAKSAVTSCFSSANVSRTMLLTSSNLLIYHGYDQALADVISADSSLWQQVQIPAAYLANHHPIRCSVISPDGRYIAVAGKRGLAHYSVTSGRWKTFDDPETERSFVVRGGMCWYQHILVAAVETDNSHEV